MSNLRDAVRPFLALPNNEYRFLAEVILCLAACIREREDGDFEARTADFLDAFSEGGYHIEANNQRILITVEE